MEKLREALRLEEERQRTQQVEQELQNDQEEQQRRAEIQADPRFQEMMDVANSPELHDALRHFAGKDIVLETEYRNHNPRTSLGVFWIHGQIEPGTEGYEQSVGQASYDLEVLIEWRDKPQRRERVFRTVTRGGGRARSESRELVYEGNNAEAGLNLQFYTSRDGFPDQDNPDSFPVFYDLDSLLNHIASRIVRNTR
jgi:hypothetical protein